jgi:hypothetical protein
MLAAAKYIGAGVACSGLISAWVSIDSLTLLLVIFGFTIILLTLGITVFKGGGRGFLEGIKAVAQFATIIAAGAGAASAGNSRDDREDRKKKEAEEAEELKKQAEEAEELKKEAAAEEAQKEKNAKKSRFS